MGSSRPKSIVSAPCACAISRRSLNWSMPAEAASLFRSSEERRPSAGAVRIGVVAMREVSRTAIVTVTTGDRGGHDDAIARAEVAYVLADLLDHSDRLVA